MRKFDVTNINFEDQMIHLRVNHPIKNGYIVARDIDLGTTMYKMKIWDVSPGLICFFNVTAKFVFDFNRDDFGGFEIQLMEGQDVLESQFIRLRYTNLSNHRIDIKDYLHPVFLNYREFFVDDIYKDLDLDNCTNVIDAGASIGLFTRYMLRKGAQNIVCIEPDPRSVAALRDNYFNRPNVEIIDKALSGRLGVLPLHFKDDNPIVSSLDTTYSEFTDLPHQEIVDVETITPDLLFNHTGWNTIDLFKIDIEGSEYEMFDSISDEMLLATKRILLEYHWDNGRLQPILDKLANLGFTSKILHEGNEGIIFFSR
jgi:FkbM family methyltransferase